MNNVKIKWLGEVPAKDSGVTWGIPWKKGKLKKGSLLKAEDENGNVLPLQSWPTAYWPDGTIKWTAHASTFIGEAPKEFYISVSDESGKHLNFEALEVKENDHQMIINTGKMICIMNKSGNVLIESIKAGDKMVCQNGYLVCLLEESSLVSNVTTTVTTEYKSVISESVLEQSGPVRCVVRVRGIHEGAGSKDTWINRKVMPFDVRFYFYAGQNSIKVVHTFLYNGNQNTDFIKGIGIKLSVPQAGELYNRHVRFAGDTGLFRETAKNLCTWRTVGKYQEMYMKQVEGEFLTFNQEEDARFLELIHEAASWDSFKMVQLVPDSYTIYKRAKEGCAYIKALSGRRSKGLAFTGGQNGGVAASIRNFWEKCPSSIEINGVTKSCAEMALWFWSPDAQAMDMRHYDTETHVYSGYEGFHEMRSTPYGIANTSEVMLWCFDKLPGNRHLLELAEIGREPFLPVCEPQTYKEAGVFGEWGLIDRSTKEKAYIEDQLDAIIDFYKNEIEVRKWYGFWDYGDVMHTYDTVRHCWRYDIGGFAWQNTELMPNMWLWYSFLRSGRRDIFRMAEAMTRHNSEVDVYHFGEYAGLGSRHNVIHWGCGCKEPRISMAALNRYYYYLTADERMGDLLDEVRDADVAVARLDPLRAVLAPNPDFDVHVRMGPDVMTFCSNWFTRWERYEDLRYRDKLIKCLDFIKENPYRFIAGKVYGYKVADTQLIDIGVSHKDSHFHLCFGAQFIWIEIANAMEDDVLKNICMDLGQFYSSYAENQDEVMKYWGVTGVHRQMSVYNTGLAAYAAKARNNKGLAREVWTLLLNDPKRSWMKLPFQAQPVYEDEYPVPVDEIPYISTNAISQWTINVIMSLGLIGDCIPEDLPEG
mgnify:FL=1